MVIVRYVSIHIIFLFVKTHKRYVKAIQIIDIECVLLSFLSKNFVSTKWRIYKGILTSSRLLRHGISRGCRANCFFQQSLQKNLYRDLRWKKSFVKEKNPFLWGFLGKAIVLNRTYYRNRRLKIHLWSNISMVKTS